ncbi:MAG: DHA2 family efflux MFS transporter permease subunit [Rhodopila sp.]|nr:DHA2 family efflux MFS transporter permease subunit [Rhodopila sp.]
MSDTPLLIEVTPPRPRSTDALTTLMVLAAGMFMAILDTNIVNVAMPAIRDSFHASLSGLTWIVDVYSLGFAGLMLTAGFLSDRFGADCIFLIGLALFIAASTLCGLANSTASLILFRLLQGLGAALFMPSSLALLRHAYPDAAARGRAVGVFGGLVSVAAAAGPVVGGVILGPLGWRGAFLVNTPIGLAALLVGRRVLRPVEPQPARTFDWLGQVLGVIALVALSYALIEAPMMGWFSGPILAALLGAAATGAGFILVENSNAAPMVPLRLFRDPSFSAANGVGFVIGLGYFGVLFILSLYLQHGLGLSPLMTGLSMLPLAALLMLGNAAAGRLVAYWGAKRQMVAGMLLGAVGFLLLAVAVSWQSFVGALAAMIPLAGGSALAIAPMTAAVLESAPPALAGTASAVLNTLRQLGALLGIACASLVIAATPDIGTAMVLGLALAALSYVFAALGAACIRSPQSQQDSQAH